MESFDLTIDEIYEAAIIPDMWPGVLTRLAKLTGSLGSILIARSDSGLRMVASDDEFLHEASEYFMTFSSHNERLVRLLRTAHHGFVSDDDVFTRAEIESEPMFRDFLIPRGYGRGIATAIPMPTGEHVILHCEGTYAAQPVDPGMVAQLQRLRPHLARAALLGTRNAFLAAQSAVDILESVGLPAVALRPDAAPVVMNGLFDTAAADWFSVQRGRLSLRDAKADRLLTDALRSVRHGQVVRSIPIMHDSRPAVLHVIPIRRSAVDLFGQSTALAILMTPHRGGPLSAPLLQTLFDLTPTEALIAQDIAGGATVRAIAAARSTHVETVRNQVKRILSKTGCARQAELQHLLAGLNGRF